VSTLLVELCEDRHWQFGIGNAACHLRDVVALLGLPHLAGAKVNDAARCAQEPNVQIPKIVGYCPGTRGYWSHHDRGANLSKPNDLTVKSLLLRRCLVLATPQAILNDSTTPDHELDRVTIQLG